MSKNKIFLPCHSSVKWSHPGDYLKAQFVIFRCQKYVKKGYMEMRKWIYLVPLGSVLGRSILHYFFSSFSSHWRGGSRFVHLFQSQPFCLVSTLNFSETAFGNFTWEVNNERIFNMNIVTFLAKKTIAFKKVLDWNGG